MGEQRKPDMDDVRKLSGSLHSGKQVRDPSDIRVAVYSCTAADYEENHKELYNSVIKNHPHWKITEIYMDKSTSGINRASYEEFSRMMEDARCGKIDYIVSKSAFRFARDLKETLNCVRELRQLDPPVGVYFKKEGDLWHLGKHIVLCGDSTKAECYDTLMDGTKANLVLSDPPYNVDVEETAGKILNDNMGDSEFYQFLLAAFQQMHGHLADDGSIYIFHADTEGLNFRKAFKDAGFYLSGCCIWKKNALVLGRSPYQWQHEPCLYGAISIRNTVNTCAAVYMPVNAQDIVDEEFSKLDEDDYS